MRISTLNRYCVYRASDKDSHIMIKSVAKLHPKSKLRTTAYMTGTKCTFLEGCNGGAFMHPYSSREGPWCTGEGPPPQLFHLSFFGDVLRSAFGGLFPRSINGLTRFGLMDGFERPLSSVLTTRRWMDRAKYWSCFVKGLRSLEWFM